MNVFVVNVGSSSVKAAYFAGEAWAHDAAEPTWSGSRAADETGHGDAVAALVRDARAARAFAPDAIGHRVVHGLDERELVPIDARVRAVIERAADLAPLHNRAALAGIDACAKVFAGVPQFADFDTAFHTTLPPEAAAFALPYDWFATRGIRRYGFHGISHRYCARRAADVLGVELARSRVVSAHLGSGASLAAIAGGASVDTTMGFTPLDGLMMGSRSGSVDPGLLLYLVRSGTASVVELERILNDESGLAGVSCVSSDVRAVIAAAEAGRQTARLALAMYVRRIAAGVAAMATALGGLDVLAFTGGVGEGSAYVRERVCARLAFLGIAVASEGTPPTGDREIGDPASRVRVVVVRAREEYAIACDIAGRLTAPVRSATSTR